MKNYKNYHAITYFKDASIYYFASKYKWDSYRKGKLAQRLPFWIKGRDFLSNARANALKVSSYIHSSLSYQLY